MTTQDDLRDAEDPIACCSEIVNAELLLTTEGRDSLIPSWLYSALSSEPEAQPAQPLGNAFDMILVVSDDDHTAAISDPYFSFKNIAYQHSVQLEIANEMTVTPENDSQWLRFPLSTATNKLRLPIESAVSFMEERCESSELEHDPKALRLLASSLVGGRNLARYLLLDHNGTILAVAPFRIFKWYIKDRITVFDIDGTITRSNIRGVVNTILTQQYSHCHEGVCHFLSNFQNSIVYLTSRPLTLANSTRAFLSNLRQEQHGLPEGPLIGFGGSLAQMLYMEIYSKNAHEFKAKALQEHVIQPFKALGVERPLQAGFGNTLMDMQAYHAAGIELSQIFWIDKQSVIYCLDAASVVVLERHEYMMARGSTFEGYRDHKLLVHLRRLPDEASIGDLVE
jgi:hypothetical protein